MTRIDDLRRKIDDVDRELVRLFSERAALAKEIGAEKRKAGMSVFDAEREREVISRAAKRGDENGEGPLAAAFMRGTVSLCRAAEQADGAHTAVYGTSGCTAVYFRAGCLRDAARFVPKDVRVMIVSDDGVPPCYAEAISSVLPKAEHFVFPAGEASKNEKTVLSLLEKLSASGFERKDFLLAVGGGVVSDVTGLAASLYLRGIRWIAVPTTLLSMADAAVGGKTGIDFAGHKNTVGAFYQPTAVFCDPETLKTLDRRQYANGAAEVLKFALTQDAEAFEMLERMNGSEIPEELIRAALFAKARIVSCDEHENGLRRVLNFGHTVGHALESKGVGLHGECVAVGMAVMSSPDVQKRLLPLCRKLGLPTDAKITKEALHDGILHDKKAENGRICAVFCEKIGTYRFAMTDPEQIIERFSTVGTLL